MQDYKMFFIMIRHIYSFVGSPFKRRHSCGKAYREKTFRSFPYACRYILEHIFWLRILIHRNYHLPCFVIGSACTMPSLHFVPLKEIERVRKSVSDAFLRAEILADMFRINALFMIRHTGSGHPGTTLSCMDIATWLWTEEMRNPNEEHADPGDIYFSSKGHDVPALYAILIGLGKLPFDMMQKLRRLGGLPGHPDRSIPYLVTNTGSLGMGISKARGMAQGKRLQGKTGRIYVLTGDGELQEGQIWESLQPTVNGKFSEITVIVDHNKIQSDVYVKDTSDLGEIEKKFKAFGWEVMRINGNDMQEIKKAIDWAKSITDRPQVVIADTLKGAGVSFMTRLADDGLYKFHSGAPTYEQFQSAVKEISDRIDEKLRDLGQKELEYELTEMPVSSLGQNWERLIPAYADELVQIAKEHTNVVAMDADLVLDTGLLQFKKEFPERYIECGIAEQDMVSMAGGLALQGMIPVVHSFECFLTTRANEHIYNNATEKTKIVYVGSLAGLLPGMPGHSHQSVRGISVLGSIPGLTLIQPANEKEARMAIRWAIEKNPDSTYIRFVSIQNECPFFLPEDYELELGKGTFLKKGKDAVIICYGPVMTTEALKAAKLLEEEKVSVAVVNFPWLNRIDQKWLSDIAASHPLIITLDDHYVALGQGVQIAGALAKAFPSHSRIVSFGIEEIPKCGHNSEVIAAHGLDFHSLAKRIIEHVKTA